ncbi:LOW QUALITY PROTEIN: NADH dehydrogenase [ubiquinone] 1 alpha subcomplex assembly factor 2 [Scyliorhinus canicula]|uniref:LOW QUALITY PROTEIN: NADH dehydrogenase [ubiquinone] 1 alpha subcomplex assembly factor 2 n=1 Tax=Scyliorhinus canicula TaxID=7830 RepID=UPI0018F27F2E|nr:LOW QUALITY PROTEIN: NADH dehydrogenase [ubiquinone] 1 alpha subcomplex assembly factor 2 [Scyliorhinus canicula]
MNQVRALLQRMFGLVKHHMGTDQFGNKYYYIPKQRNWIGQTFRSRRIIEAFNPKEFEYEGGNIPSEWEAWIRGRRKDPPTMEEILRNEEYRKMIKIHAHEVEQKEEMRKKKEYEDGLVAQPVQTEVKGHASATYFGKDKISPDPSSTAKTFQPGGWFPETSNKKK